MLGVVRRQNDFDFPTVFDGIADFRKAHAHIFEKFAQVVLMLVAHLNHHARILGKQRLDDVAVGANVVQIHVQAAFRVGKSHFQQGRDEAASRNVVSGHHPTAPNQLLNGVEAIDEIVGIFDCRNVAAHFSEALREGRTAESLLAERKIDVVEARPLVIDHDGAHHLAHIAHFTATANDDRAWRNDFLAVGILLRH